METTDPQDELFDVVDEWGEPLGYSKPRGDVHRDGDWHRSLHLWIWGVADDEPFILFQRRSLTKDTFPGKLDVSVGGHIRAGETLEETVREAREEIGLELRFEDLTLLGTRFHTSLAGQLIDREVMAVFAYRTDQPLDAYELHPEEVSGLARITLDNTRAVFTGEAEQVLCLEWDGQSAPAPRTVRLDDFAGGWTYLEPVLAAISTLADGEPFKPFEIRTRSQRA